MDSSGQEKKTAAQAPSEIAQNLKVADENATFKYDESARNIVAQKSVLAYILKSALDEYAAYTVQEIAERFIEGEPELTVSEWLSGCRITSSIHSITNEKQFIHFFYSKQALYLIAISVALPTLGLRNKAGMAGVFKCCHPGLFAYRYSVRRSPYRTIRWFSVWSQFRYLCVHFFVTFWLARYSIFSNDVSLWNTLFKLFSEIICQICSFATGIKRLLFDKNLHILILTKKKPFIFKNTN